MEGSDLVRPRAAYGAFPTTLDFGALAYGDNHSHWLAQSHLFKAPMPIQLQRKERAQMLISPRTEVWF
jgi:hypothetical protein